MAYVTGTANSLTDLLTAIQNACTGNGWTLSGSVLHKGTCYVEIKISGSVITIRGGTGVDGSNNLTGATDRPSGQLGIAAPRYGNTIPMRPPFSYPVAYYIHINQSPDEVYAVVNYATNFYQSLGFGQSSMPGLTGTGNWYAAMRAGNYLYIITYGPNGSGLPASFGLFYNDSNVAACGVDHRLDSGTWTADGGWRDWASLFYRQPNQWNQESILIPMRVYAPRPSGFISPVLECAHARYVNIANFSDQQIITLGSDRWKVYPWWARGDSNSIYTGLCGHAMRYDGP